MPGFRKTNYDGRLSVLVETQMWDELEAYSRFRQLNGKSTIVRHAVREWLNAQKLKMSSEEMQLYNSILENIQEPAKIEEITP